VELKKNFSFKINTGYCYSGTCPNFSGYLWQE